MHFANIASATVAVLALGATAVRTRLVGSQSLGRSITTEQTGSEASDQPVFRRRIASRTASEEVHHLAARNPESEGPMPHPHAHGLESRNVGYENSVKMAHARGGTSRSRRGKTAASGPGGHDQSGIAALSAALSPSPFHGSRPGGAPHMPKFGYWHELQSSANGRPPQRIPTLQKTDFPAAGSAASLVFPYRAAFSQNPAQTARWGSWNEGVSAPLLPSSVSPGSKSKTKQKLKHWGIGGAVATAAVATVGVGAEVYLELKNKDNVGI